jgi:hypothetical protein
MMGWVVVAIIVVVLVEIAAWKEVFSGKAASWRFYLWTLFTLYAGVCAAYGYWGWHSQKGSEEEEVGFAALMAVLGALAALFIDRAGVKVVRVVMDILEANRRSP